MDDQALELTTLLDACQRILPKLDDDSERDGAGDPRDVPFDQETP